MTRDWHIYEVSGLSLQDWKAYGLQSDLKVTMGEMMHFLRAVLLLMKVVPQNDWFGRSHEFWTTPCPGAPPVVAVRFASNPFDSGYLISPIPLPHLTGTRTWVEQSA